LRAALEATQVFLRADLMPDAMEAVNRDAFEAMNGSAGPDPWLLLIRFGETEEAVRWQLDRIREIAPAGGRTVLNVLDTRESGDFWQRAASARESAGNGNELLLKCSVLYRAVADIECRMSEMGQRLQARTLLFCHAGTSILYGPYDWPQEGCDAGDLRREITELRRHCAASGGHLVVEKVRPEVKQGLDVWGYQAPAVEMMRRIKKQFDPKGLLNPGRFVGGI
jgi:glycolate oxidase FAD binding subunit